MTAERDIQSPAQVKIRQTEVSQAEKPQRNLQASKVHVCSTAAWDRTNTVPTEALAKIS